MLLSAFLVPIVVCSHLQIFTGQLNLAKLDGWQCVAASQVLASGVTHRQGWDRVNMTNATFTSAKLVKLRWFNSELQKVYFRGSELNQVAIRNNQLNNISLINSILGEVTIVDSTGGWWTLDQSSVDTLSLKGSEVEGVNLNHSAVTSLSTDRSTLKAWTFRESPIKILSLGKTRIQTIKVANAPVEKFELVTVSGKGFHLSGLVFQKGLIENSKVKDVIWNQVGINHLQVKNSEMDIVRLQDTTQFYQSSFEDSTLNHVHFDNVGMDFVNFSRVTFKEARFERTKISHARFENVRFESSDLTGLSLGEAVEFIGCTYDSATKWPWPPDQMAKMGLILSP